MFRLILRKKFGYGKYFYYPVSADAKLLCEILQKDTLMQWQVELLKADERFEITLEAEAI